ncbi:hypothetical protein [Corynebacterium epidermidicanis]|uniref:Uncharacterized protein n=1 Tax=Corynebacterium epidermidicanis TaxID=1050174 RepID=A0A0G3GU05_9CORY|nr:hypothetical protein [Corynebacterium epidermidicanis]AKK02337.1 hypothetical protein CEPID_02280 [Corynebacterium epidermidicanis]
MSRLQGESVRVVTGVQRNQYGKVIGTTGVDFLAVVVPESTDTLKGDGGGLVAVVATRARLLVPHGWSVPAGVKPGAEIEVRGATWYVDGEVSKHVSPFGTRVGGVEVKLSKSMAGGVPL